MAHVRESASQLARCALHVVRQRFPYKMDHLVLSPGDVAHPHELHPLFEGCYDWHSSVHMHWSLLRLLELAPDLPERSLVIAHFDATFTSQAAAAELGYLCTPGRETFERPYGWAWLLKLHAELVRHERAGWTPASRWAEALHPLAVELSQRLSRHVAQLDYPVRSGTHANTAFSLFLALQYARLLGDSVLNQALRSAAQRLFGADQCYPAHYEPSGADFLSPGLCEAALMAEVLGAGFPDWWRRFQPADLTPWLVPVAVTDRSDPQVIHLEGLNLSRAWALRRLTTAIGGELGHRFLRSSQVHWDASFPHVASGDFVATHWLMSFALLR